MELQVISLTWNGRFKEAKCRGIADRRSISSLLAPLQALKQHSMLRRREMSNKKTSRPQENPGGHQTDVLLIGYIVVAAQRHR